MKDIYGCASSCNNSCDLGDIVGKFKLKMETIFIDTFIRFKIVIDTLITTKVKAVSFLGEMGGRSTATAVIVIYMRWVNMNPGVEFSIENRLHISQIKDIYLSAGLDWRSDPIIGIKNQPVQEPVCRKAGVETTKELISHTL